MPLHFPPDIILAICTNIYYAGLPAPAPTLDPLVIDSHPGIPIGLPSSVPPGHWSERLARRTLKNLCLVNRAWYAGAKPWLWRRIEVRLPRSWLSFVEEVAWVVNDDPTEQQTSIALKESIKAAADAALASSSITSVPSEKKDAATELEERILQELIAPDSPIPIELLSPPASRDPSPRRLRAKSKSPARWRIMRTVNDAIRNVIQHEEPGVYVPVAEDPRPGRHIRHLDFNHFRTIGMRRSVDEGVNSRFVTGARLGAVLKEMSNLTAFGATEYMDGALTLPVLKDLFLRGLPARGRGRTSRGRALPDEATDNDDDDRERRRDCKALEAIDFTGCVSGVFVNALSEFVATQIVNPGSSEQSSSGSEDDGAPPSRRLRPRVSFPGLLRLGLRGVKSVTTQVLMPFVLAFPSLTHLDLSCTRATTELLAALARSDTVRLHSLSIGRCVLLTGQSIRDFLVGSPVTAGLRELSLYGDSTYTSPLSAQDLTDIFTLAPCFLSGKLVYLDLSSSPVSAEMLADSLGPQPNLRSLGLSHVPDLPLPAIMAFVRAKAPAAEVLTLVGTSPELARGSSREASIALHTHVVMVGAARGGADRVRVVELAPALLASLGAGAGSWRIVRSKGGRGWYVDTASGWVGAVLRRDLERGHALREALERLADANGNVGSGVGWHARKMEILHGNGMVGREDGLYGAVSFAYQG